MGVVVNLEEYRRNREQAEAMSLDTYLKDMFVQAIQVLDLPNTTGGERRSERVLDEEDIQELPEDIKDMLPPQEYKLIISRGSLLASISISNSDGNTAVEVQAPQTGGLRMLLQKDNELIESPDYNPNTPEGRKKIDHLAAILLKLADKPPFGPPQPAT